MQIVFLAFIAWGIYKLQRELYGRYWDKNLEVDVNFSERRITEGTKFYLIETVKNNKWLPLPLFYIKFKLSRNFIVDQERPKANDDCLSRTELLNLMMKQKIERKLEIVCNKRGEYEVGNIIFVVKSLFLDMDFGMEKICRNRIVVLPRAVNAGRFEELVKDLRGDMIQGGTIQEDFYLKRGIREYQTYDEPKYINWNVTAKMGDMKVNILDKLTNRNGFVYLNLHRDSVTLQDEVLEESIRLAKSFCMFFSKKGIKSCLFTNGTDGVRKTPISVKKLGIGFEYLSYVDEALVKINLKREDKYSNNHSVDFVEHYGVSMLQNARDGFIVVISNSCEEELKAVLYDLKRRGAFVLWIVPVNNGADYKEDDVLKENMRMWRLNYESAQEV